jgi:hypothetical protein
MRIPFQGQSSAGIMCRFDTDFQQISNSLISLELLERLTILAPRLGEKSFRDLEIRFLFLDL